MSVADDDLTSLVRETFLALADVLEKQPDSSWDGPSLCEAWRVRDVVAHVSTAARYAPAEYMAEVQADGGDFGRTLDRLAAQDGQLDREVLLENLRDDRLHQWIPPGGVQSGALTHAVIHGLDATVPLGIEGWLVDEARLKVLDVLTGDGVHALFGTRIENSRLEATDLSWVYGDGKPVAATSDALILALAGRQLPAGRISGSLR